MFYLYLGDSLVFALQPEHRDVASSRETVVKMPSVWEYQAPCQNIPCVFGRCGVSPDTGSGREVQRVQVPSSEGWHQCTSACDFRSLGIRVPWK